MVLVIQMLLSFQSSAEAFHVIVPLIPQVIFFGMSFFKTVALSLIYFYVIIVFLDHNSKPKYMARKYDKTYKTQITLY